MPAALLSRRLKSWWDSEGLVSTGILSSELPAWSTRFLARRVFTLQGVLVLFPADGAAVDIAGGMAQPAEGRNRQPFRRRQSQAQNLSEGLCFQGWCTRWHSAFCQLWQFYSLNQILLLQGSPVVDLSRPTSLHEHLRSLGLGADSGGSGSSRAESGDDAGWRASSAGSSPVTGSGHLTHDVDFIRDSLCEAVFLSQSPRGARYEPSRVWGQK